MRSNFDIILVDNSFWNHLNVITDQTGHFRQLLREEGIWRKMLTRFLKKRQNFTKSFLPLPSTEINKLKMVRSRYAIAASGSIEHQRTFPPYSFSSAFFSCSMRTSRDKTNAGFRPAALSLYVWLMKQNANLTSSGLWKFLFPEWCEKNIVYLKFFILLKFTLTTRNQNLVFSASRTLFKTFVQWNILYTEEQFYSK